VEIRWRQAEFVEFVEFVEFIEFVASEIFRDWRRLVEIDREQ
jgi:hypothetical protein